MAVGPSPEHSRLIRKLESIADLSVSDQIGLSELPLRLRPGDICKPTSDIPASLKLTDLGAISAPAPPPLAGDRKWRPMPTGATRHGGRAAPASYRRGAGTQTFACTLKPEIAAQCGTAAMGWSSRSTASPTFAMRRPFVAPRQRSRKSKRCIVREARAYCPQGNQFRRDQSMVSGRDVRGACRYGGGCALSIGPLRHRWEGPWAEKRFAPPLLPHRCRHVPG